MMLGIFMMIFSKLSMFSQTFQTFLSAEEKERTVELVWEKYYPEGEPEPEKKKKKKKKKPDEASDGKSLTSDLWHYISIVIYI